MQIAEEEEGRRVTIAVDPRSLVQVIAEGAPEAHLGDRVFFDVTIPAPVRLELAPAEHVAETLKEGS